MYLCFCVVLCLMPRMVCIVLFLISMLQVFTVHGNVSFLSVVRYAYVSSCLVLFIIYLSSYLIHDPMQGCIIVC